MYYIGMYSGLIGFVTPNLQGGSLKIGIFSLVSIVTSLIFIGGFVYLQIFGEEIHNALKTAYLISLLITLLGITIANINVDVGIGMYLVGLLIVAIAYMYTEVMDETSSYEIIPKEAT